MNDDELIIRRKKQNADRARAYRKRQKDLAKLSHQKQLNAERCRRYREKCKRLKSGANLKQGTSDSNETKLNIVESRSQSTIKFTEAVTKEMCSSGIRLFFQVKKVEKNNNSILLTYGLKYETAEGIIRDCDDPMAFSKEPSKYDKGLLPKPSWSADRGGQSSTVEPPSTPEQNSSDCDPVYDTPLEARLRKQLTRKTALYVKHSKHNILLRQKVIRLKRKCASLKQVLLSNPQKKKRSQEELELIEQLNKDSTDEDISGDGSSDEEISNETRTGASKATRANMASSDDSDYEGELYDFGNFVTEQLLSLNVEESRVAQMKIKNLLAEFMKTHTVDSYSEPSTSKTQPTQSKKRKMQSKAKQHKNKAVTEPASELQTHSLSLSDTPLQFEVQQMRNDTAITQAGYVVTPTLTDGVNWVKNEGFTVLLAGFDTSPEVFMAQSEPAQAVSYGTPVDQISVKVEPGATSTESPLYADTIVKVEPSETEGSLQAAEKESVVFKIEPEEPEEEEV